MEKELKTERIALRVTKKDLDDLRAIADEMSLDVSAIVYMAIMQYKKNHYLQKALTENLSNVMKENLKDPEYVSKLANMLNDGVQISFDDLNKNGG